MCHSSKVNFPTSTIRTFERPSPTLKRRCVSLSAMSDLPTCPVVNAFHQTSAIPAEWEDDVLSIAPISILDNSKNEHVCHICAGVRWDFRAVASVERRIPNTDDAMETYSGIMSLLSVLKRSSQPAHFIVLVAVALTAYVLNPPRSLALSSTQPSLTWSLTYLGSFSILFGSQMWMTFVSGLVLLFILPRHTFARVQSALFPKYMCLSSAMGLFTLAAFVEHHPAGLWKSSDVTQAACLTFCCLAPLLARLYIVPRLLNHIAAKVALERAAGHGAEAGPRLGNKSLDVLRQCIKYKDVCHSFRLSHMSVAIINMTALGCNVFHLHYLASKLCFT